MNLVVILAVVLVMFGLRFLKINILAWFGVWWAGIYIILNYAVEPPLPSSIIGMFMAIVTLVLLAYLSSNSSYLADSSQKLVRFMVDKKYTIPLVIVLIALPALMALRVYINVTQEPQAPVSSRTIHPPPPVQIAFKGKTMNLVETSNPYRPLEQTDPNGFAAHVENGRRVYYENCVFCHGDNMEGDGIFAHGFDPIPANFNDPTTIAMLQESYLFWRVAKGAPGLPDESTPWASAMPAWEKFLTEEEIWDVILFLYDFTGYKPRAQEELH